jgi:hypothetical protein
MEMNSEICVSSPPPSPLYYSLCMLLTLSVVFIHIFDTFCKLFIRLHDLLVLLLEFVFEHVVRDRLDKNKKFFYSLASLQILNFCQGLPA